MGSQEIERVWTLSEVTVFVCFYSCSTATQGASCAAPGTAFQSFAWSYTQSSPQSSSYQNNRKWDRPRDIHISLVSLKARTHHATLGATSHPTLCATKCSVSIPVTSLSVYFGKVLCAQPNSWNQFIATMKLCAMLWAMLHCVVRPLITGCCAEMRFGVGGKAHQHAVPTQWYVILWTHAQVWSCSTRGFLKKLKNSGERLEILQITLYAKVWHFFQT